MNDPVTIALVSVSGVIFGAIATAVSSSFTARQKVREIESTYRQKTRDTYLQNARLVLEKVYIPLSIAITELSIAFDNLRFEIDIFEGKDKDERIDKFIDACSKFENFYTDDICRKGGDAYLVIELDEELRSLDRLLIRSFNADTVLKRVTIRTEIRIMPFLPALPLNISRDVSNKWKMPNISLEGIWFGGSTFRSYEEVLAAPYASSEFEIEFKKHVAMIKNLIRDVTLGSSSIPQA